MAKNDSFFNEIYGTYFNVVSSILRQAQEKQLTKDSLELLVREQAFADSCLTIPKALQDGSWPLLQKDMTTPLRHAPVMPLTTVSPAPSSAAWTAVVAASGPVRMVVTGSGRPAWAAAALRA